MLYHPPQEKEWLSWLFVVLWSGIIYATIPLARAIQGWVGDNLGSQAFLYFVISVVAVATVIAAIRQMRVQPARDRTNIFWLILVAAVFIGYAIKLRANAEEAVHFVEYGVLGILIYRALCHRVRDVSIYFGVAMVGALVGTIDEMIQWTTPKRFWALGDIWLNLMAVSLVQVAIARGFRPTIITSGISAPRVRWLCRLASGLILLVALNLLNTPARIAWYAEKIPALQFLIKNESVMFEYGYRYADPEIGVFKSRLAPHQLKEADATRGESAAKILDAYQEPSTYGAFLEEYTPTNDPFLHEARVHLFRRDRYLRKAKELEMDLAEYRYRLSVAFYENRIMEKYFHNTLHHSNYVLPPQDIDLMRANLIADMKYESAVSKSLVTGFQEEHTIAILASIFFGIALVRRKYGSVNHA